MLAIPTDVKYGSLRKIVITNNYLYYMNIVQKHLVSYISASAADLIANEKLFAAQRLQCCLCRGGKHKVRRCWTHTIIKSLFPCVGEVNTKSAAVGPTP